MAAGSRVVLSGQNRKGSGSAIPYCGKHDFLSQEKGVGEAKRISRKKFMISLKSSAFVPKDYGGVSILFRYCTLKTS